MEDQNYTIKDIARMAGVSAGTVDRVLHNRGDVSLKSKEKVQKVLDEIHYQPNVFAIGLAAKKKYSFVCLLPYYVEYDYWHSVVVGIERARQELRPFNVNVEYSFYSHGDRDSYQKACQSIEESNVDAVLIAPNFKDETLKLIAHLKKYNVTYAFVDFNIEDTGALAYIGQDSYRSGYIAAKLLMQNYSADEAEELVVFLSNSKDNPAEIQMNRRLDGFMKYIAENNEGLTVHEVVLNKENQASNRLTLDNFFRNHHRAVLGVVFNSHVYQLGDYLRHAGIAMKGLIGYDLLKANVELLKTEHVHYLIGQRPELQGYCGVTVLCDHVVFKKPVDAVKYMPIDVLIKENIDFYFEFV